ncbi:MAG TPA: HYR domain-containing protein, partial [Candidatus Dormibacteraeota bacterium]|nr:HYR domain-containing protein [Candidatus Dormibacteraeota bacterium]
MLRWTISNPPCPSSQADVTIQIGTPPTITCPTSPVVANTEPGQCSAHVTFTVTATGVPTPTVTCTPPSGSVFQKGNTTVNCTAANGVQPDATCSFTVTVNDMQPPSITCPANITQSTDPNLCTAVVSYVTPTASDNCPCGAAPVKSKPNVASCAVVCAPASGSTFQKGTTTVTCTATDTSGNQASCSFTVTVNDTQPPSITCPANITKSTDPNLCTAVVTYNAPGVSDNCPGVGTP